MSSISYRFGFEGELPGWICMLATKLFFDLNLSISFLSMPISFSSLSPARSSESICPSIWHILCGSNFSIIFWNSSPNLRCFKTSLIRLTYLSVNSNPLDIFLMAVVFSKHTVSLADNLLLMSDRLVFKRTSLFSISTRSYLKWFFVTKLSSIFSARFLSL